ncbi:MAG: helix-turn-helix transcriptional regulator [Aliidongia sp.]
MTEQPGSGDVLSDRFDRTPAEQEVGHIALGTRRFAVRLLPETADRPAPHEICRFALAGRVLAVFETFERHRDAAGDALADLAQRLSGRELEIAVLVAQGHANKNIAYRLQISEWTVGTYMRRIFLKLDVESRAAMVYRCAPLINASLVPQKPAHRPARDDL